jgi:hypothetical protein
LKLNRKIYRRLLFIVAGFISISINGCKEDFPSQNPVTWFLTHDDSIMCKRIDNKDTITFIFNDSSQNIFKFITAIKTKSEHLVTVSKSQDIDPSRNMGAKITVHWEEYTYWDSANNFPLIISIFPTFDKTGTIRLPSLFKMYFNNRFNHHRSIRKDGLPSNFIVYDSFTYNNNRLYRNCNYNPEAVKLNASVLILDTAGFPMWIENKVHKINVDFLPK